jgi:hypothetical protein
MEHVALPQFALSRIRFDLPRPADATLPEWIASIAGYQAAPSDPVAATRA